MDKYNIYLLKQFNNYHSRKVKFSSEILDYLTGDYGQPYDFKMNQPTKVDFNPNDGVTTTLIVNWNEAFEPDYCIVQDDVEDTSGNKPFTCWFVMEWVRTRGKQYKCTLRRDVIRDHFYPVLNAHSFIEKAILPNDGSNPLIFNNENMTYNQIKKEEVLLKDKTNTAWIVGYCQRDAFKDENDAAITISVTPSITNFIDISSDVELVDPLNPLAGVKAKTLNGNITVINNIKNATGTHSRLTSNVNVVNNELISTNVTAKLGESPRSLVSPQNDLIISENLKTAFEYYANDFKTAFFNTGENDKLLTTERMLTILWNVGTNKPVRINGNYYILRLASETTHTFSEDIKSSTFASLYAVYENINAKWADLLNGTVDKSGNPYGLKYKYREYNFVLENYVSDNTLKTTINNSHTNLEDSPYDMFFLKYTQDNLNLAQEMVRVLTTAKIFDVQILPYIPECNVLDDDGTIRRTLGTQGADYYKILRGSTEEEFDYIYFATKSSRTFGIEYDFGINDYKVQNETEFCRLVSPNWNGAYDFSPAKNGGISGFHVDITYKPFTPYIHVAPVFSGIYGTIQDARGLICNGDFSISMMSDSWSQYEINNKNYQNIFNAQIKTMDKNNRLQLGSNIASSMMGAAATGIGAGVLTGNAAIGVVAGAASAIGGAIDVGLNQQMYQNNRQLQIDQFGYHLQNIAARPDTLNKVSTLTANNMLFPFIEFYSATDEEKEMLKNKIKFNGMTVMAIGNIADYSDNFYEGMCYVQARIIHIDDNAPMDYHMMATINEEMMKGVYIVWLSNQE